MAEDSAEAVRRGEVLLHTQQARKIAARKTIDQLVSKFFSDTIGNREEDSV